MLLFQEIISSSQSSTNFDVQRILESIVPAVVVGIVTYFVTRQKNISEASRNDSEAKKNYAEIDKIHLDLIKSLSEEIEEWAGKVKVLRVDADDILKENDDLKKQIKRAKENKEDKILELQSLIKIEKQVLIESVERIIKTMTSLLDILISQGIAQTEKMQAVNIIESLHKLKDLLKK